MSKIKFFFGTTFYSALVIRQAPGTSTSLLSAIVFFLCGMVSIYLHIALIVVIIGLHFFCFRAFENQFENDDPAVYTLDEALAVGALSFYSNHLIYVLSSLILFRYFDIFKPLGIKHLESVSFLPSWARNIADDLAAALYAFILILAFQYVF